MKIAIISDSHDNIANMEKALQWINKEGIKTIIHCGDLCAPSILREVIIPNFCGEIHLVHGNVGDAEALEKIAKNFKNVHIYNWHYSIHARRMIKKQGTIMGCGEIELNGIKIAFTHTPNNAKTLAQTGKYDYVFYGHTHKPWIEQIPITNKQTPNKSQIINPKSSITNLVNPGTLAGMFYKATFAVLDTITTKLELKILERL